MALAILLCCTPELVFAAMGEPSQQPGSQDAAPLNSVPQSASSVPDAPQPAQADSAGQKNTAPPNSSTPTQPTQPQGTAAARAATTIGGPASKPAGSAIAPAKQRQMRSLLIKIGVIAGAGVALGTVYALTRGTPSRPPGAH